MRSKIIANFVLIVMTLLPRLALCQVTNEGFNLEHRILESGKRTNSTARNGKFYEVIISIENVQVTASPVTSAAQLSFDVFIKSNSDETYLDNCILRIFYDSLLLGSNIAQNSAFALTPASEFATSQYTFTAYNADWYARNLLGIGITTLGNTGSQGRVNITTQKKLLCSLAVPIRTCSSTTFLNLAQYYQDPLDININNLITYTTNAKSADFDNYRYDYITTNGVFAARNASSLCNAFQEGFNNYGSPFYASRIETCSSTTVNPGAFVYLRGAQSITLKPGFTAKTGSEFYARLGILTQAQLNCNTSLLTSRTAQIYPNPVVDKQIMIVSSQKQTTAQGKIEFISSSGVVHFTKNVSQLEDMNCDVSSLPPGIYLVKVTMGSEVSTQRLVIK